MIFSAAFGLARDAGQDSNSAAPPPRSAWTPALLYGMIASPNPAALNALYDAAFAAGPAIVPQLEAALQDDRTAEFAAQSLAFIGGEAAFKVLSKLPDDPRNLGLARYFYGALGESNTPQANAYLLNVIRNANSQPDRTVTEAAIVALTVHPDAALIPQIKQAEAKLTDPVIQDDLENAVTVIEERGKYDATHAKTGGSLQQAVDAYFEPALTPGGAPQKPGAQPPPPAGQARITHVEFNPGGSRALAQVRFEDAGVGQGYRIVLQKKFGDWTVASVWLTLQDETSAGPAQQKTQAPPQSAH